MTQQASRPRLLAPYAAFAFTLGLGWFVLAPLVPVLMAHFHIALGSALLPISLFGYAMIVGSLPAGFWVARQGPGPALKLAVALTAAGLITRALAADYPVFVVGQALAALAYPLLIAPIGAVLRLGGLAHLKSATGLVIGTLFFGMAVGALLGGHLRPSTDLWLAVTVNLLAGFWLWTRVARLEPPTPVTLGPVRLVMSGWWVIGFVVASTTVMMGSVSSAALTHLHVASALTLGSLLTALTFVGSAVGAAAFGWIGQRAGDDTRRLQQGLGIVMWVVTMAAGAVLTGLWPVRGSGLDALFLLLGLVGNGWYALALESAARDARSAGSAGLATAGYSLASNVGVAVLPTLLGPLVVTAALGWWTITTLLAVAAAVMPFVLGPSAPAAAGSPS